MPEQGAWLRRLREQRAAYLTQAAEMERGKSPFAGAFGMRGGPADDPCHERYVSELRALLDEGAPEDPAELRAGLEELYAPPPRDCPRSAYWMLLAVQGLTEGLIPSLDPADALALAERYRRDYPRHQRLPVQEKLLRALKQRSE